MTDIIADILAERGLQDKKWGEQNHSPYQWITILAEEIGEASEAALGGDVVSLRSEMVQVAAVAVAFIECIDRHE